MQRIGEDVSEKLDFQPGVFTVERHIRGKWVCKCCERIVQAPVAPDHVTSDTCRSCHPGNYTSWHESFHRTMTQVVTPRTVAAELHGTELTAGGTDWRIEKTGDAYAFSSYRVTFEVRCTLTAEGGKRVLFKDRVFRSTATSARATSACAGL